MLFSLQPPDFQSMFEYPILLQLLFLDVNIRPAFQYSLLLYQSTPKPTALVAGLKSTH